MRGTIHQIIRKLFALARHYCVSVGQSTLQIPTTSVHDVHGAASITMWLSAGQRRPSLAVLAHPRVGWIFNNEGFQSAYQVSITIPTSPLQLSAPSFTQQQLQQHARTQRLRSDWRRCVTHVSGTARCGRRLVIEHLVHQTGERGWRFRDVRACCISHSLIVAANHKRGQFL